MNIYTHRAETIAASKFIEANIRTAFITCANDINYYNVNGVVWEVWQYGTGKYPESTGVLIEDFYKIKATQSVDLTRTA